jgi:glutamate/tyrosine decarboxylase-like PLP-dependent enzyme
VDHRDGRITLDGETVRRLGYEIVDAIARRVDDLPERKVGEPATRAAMEALLQEPAPEHGSDPHSVLETVLRDVVAPGLRVDHPRFFAYTPIPGNPVGALADALVAGSSLFAGTWQGAPGAAMVELVTLEWLRDICGLPETTEGLFVSGGSMANMTALAVALEERARGERARATVYLSEEAHSSVTRALRVLGVQPEHIRTLAADDAGRLVTSQVAEEIDADRAAGRLPACVVATAGTTGTAAIDPLPELRRLCDDNGLWLHVDGAYGAAAMITTRGRALLRGIEAADSLTLDPHKWLFQPLEAGCLLVRDGAALERVFSVSPAYLRDTAGAEAEVNFAERGLQLTRQFRALKLWMSIKVFGLEAYRTAIDNGIDLAEHAERLLARDPTWEIVTPAQLGMVTFRAVARGAPAHELDELNARLPAAALADGFMYLTTTQARGMTVLRLCTINPRTTREDVEQVVERLRALVGRG